MPKIVDHDQRRQDIVLAALRVVARGGVAKATMREIAREAGYSTGMVVHYFDGREQLMSRAHRAAYLIVSNRIRQNISDFRTLEDLRVAVEEALPMDESRLVEAQIDVAFWDEALREETFRQDRWRNHFDAQREWMQVFARLRSAGAITAPDTDEELAIQLVVLIDGLTVQRLLYPQQMTPELLDRILRRHLERLA